MADDVPLFLRSVERPIELSVAVHRQRHEQARRVLQRIKRRRQSGLRQARGNDAGLRGAADLEGFGHGAEIRHQARRHRGRDRHSSRRLRGIETAQFGACCSSSNGAEHGRRMPALAMQRRRLAQQKLGPHFVAGDIGRQHFGAARSVCFALGKNRRHQDRARMAVERHIVVVQHVRGNAVDQGRGFGTAPRARGNKRSERRAAAMAQLAIDQRNFRIAAACNQDAEAVGDAGAGDGATFRRNLLQGEIGDEAAEILGERAHVRPPLRDRAG